MIRGRILIVDNDCNNLIVLKDFLKDFTVVIRGNLRETMQEAASNHYDLIIINMQTRGLDTLNLIESLKRQSSTIFIPVIVLSNGVNSALEDKAFDLGVDDFINLKSSVSTICSRIFKVTGSHIKRTAAYVNLVLRGLLKKRYYEDVLDDEHCEACVAAAPLHDIGKITVSDTILCKPGRLTIDEFSIMQTHAEKGGQMIAETLTGMESSLILATAVDMATYHHEKWNGTGYPYSLKGDEIPLSARIMSIADVFDALVSKRCYKPAMSYDEAFRIISSESGKHFDPKITEVFLGMRDEIVAVSEN